MKFWVVIERTPRNYSAYVPDLPGCISTAKTLADIKRNIRQGIAFHVGGMKQEGLPIPGPATSVALVEIA